MRIAYYDSGDPEMYFGNPNLHWGEPSYLLEPGDPGYVEPIPTVNKPTKKGKQMKHARYYPERQADQVAWLANFIAKLASYATALGLTTGQVTAAVADCGWLMYILDPGWARGAPGTRPAPPPSSPPRPARAAGR